MAKKTKRKGEPPFCPEAFLEQLRAETEQRAAQAFGTSAMAAVDELADAAGELLATVLKLDVLTCDMSDNEKKIVMRFYKQGYRHGFLAAARQSQTARGRGIAKATHKRQRSATSRYADMVAYYARTAGTESQREKTTAAHFGVTDRTVRRALKTIGM
jgi:hypothetical protein